MKAAADISRALNEHPWLAAAHVGNAGVLLLLSPIGHAQLLRQGRQSLLDALQVHLAALNLDPPPAWRLLDDDATLDATAIERLINLPRPRTVTPLAESECEGQWQLTLRLPLDLIHFDDHFRHAPVLPGVVQVSFALALAATRLGTSTHCREMEALKFQRLLRPGDQLELRLHYEEDEQADGQRGKLHFAYRLDDSHCSSGRLRVARTHD